MLKYRISDPSTLNFNKPKPIYESIYEEVSSDYKKYINLPREYQIQYPIIFASIYSCQSRVNSYKDKDAGIEELSTFLKFIETIATDRKFKAIKDINGTISFKTRLNQKVKRRQRAA